MEGATVPRLLPPGWDESEQKLIDLFFEKKVPAAAKAKDKNAESISASQCLAYAQSLMKSDNIMLLDNQGCNSYTLVCPDHRKIIQFRLEELDMKSIEDAKQTYGSLVSDITHHDTGFGLPAYTSDIVPGQLHYWQDISKSSFPLEREVATVVDLAKLISRASHFPRPVSSYKDSSWTKSASAKFQRLIANTTLRKIVPEVYEELAIISGKLILLETLPPVLTHRDLVSQNMFVDDTGALTGVIDFDEAEIEAFGMGVFGLYECIFGDMEGGVWAFYDFLAKDSHPPQSVYQVLTKVFWNTFWEHVVPELKREDAEEAVWVALEVGIVNRYFVEGMLDKIDLDNSKHKLSVEYARGILLRVRDERQGMFGKEKHSPLMMGEEQGHTEMLRNNFHVLLPVSLV
ncbi:hypothetical protein MMC28_010682 [Mycoblastus sanguinarius]|nr:hypothetical protein [Mycoblastus sanguinarius]